MTKRYLVLDESVEIAQKFYKTIDETKREGGGVLGYILGYSENMGKGKDLAGISALTLILLMRRIG